MADQQNKPEENQKKTIVVARQKTIVVKGKGFGPFKKTPKPEEADKIINNWMQEMALKGQPAQLGKYLSCNGDLVYLFLYNERIPLPE